MVFNFMSDGCVKVLSTVFVEADFVTVSRLYTTVKSRASTETPIL